MINASDLQRAADFLEERFGLESLWLYGSEAKGMAGPESDVDFGALFRRRPTALEVFEAREELAEILHREVDLVDLDQASPILSMQVLRYGRLLVDRNPKRLYAFFSRAVNMYEDVKIIRREAERRLYERMSGGRP